MLFIVCICLALASTVAAQCCSDGCGATCGDTGAWCAESVDNCNQCGGKLCNQEQAEGQPQQRHTSHRSTKRGIAIRHPSAAQLHALEAGLDWFYSWSKTSPQASSSLKFFPMVHGRSEVQQGLEGHAYAILGFNEPELESQSHMSPQEAAGLWHQVEAKAHTVQKLVSPAMCGDIGRGTAWMRSFLGACQGCRIDAIAIHSYYCDVADIQRLVDAYRGFGKPIWLTEFACAVQGRDVSMQGQIKFMKEVVPWLEQEGAIEKYAWFGYFKDQWSYPITSPNPDAGLAYGDGRLSELGQVYLSFASGRRLEVTEDLMLV